MSDLNYSLHIEEVRTDQYGHLVSFPNLDVFSFPLKHRVPTLGYKFVEKAHQYNVDKEAIAEYDLTVEEIKLIKKGQDIERDQITLKSEDLILSKRRKRSFAYCSDTVYDACIVGYVSGVDLLYHEATYTHDMEKKAKLRMHSTAFQAATIASKAQVKRLLIGHYSSRYKDLSPLIEEARDVFPDSELALEGRIIPV